MPNSSIWNRLVTAARMAVLAFNEKALIPTDNYEWNDYQSRLFRYALAEAYYANIAYRNISSFSSRLKSNSSLYRHIRGIYNPVSRLTEAYAAKVYGGSLDFEDLSRGAIPLTMASDELKLAIRQLWLWSNWGIQKTLYVRYGAQLGDVFLKVIDEPEKEKVRLEIVHPGKIKDCVFDAVGNVKEINIEYERVEPDGKTWYVYGEKITQQSFATTKAGKPYAYNTDENGKGVTEWPNPYGFVPMVLTKHKDMGQVWGANAFHGQIGKIDELNDAASLLNDQVRKAVNVMWYFAGATKRPTLDTSTENKDEIAILYGPSDSQPFAMIAPVDITAAGANIQALLSEIERDMPELALHRLRDGGNLTAPGVRSAYSDAIDRFTEAQGTYDDGLIRAHKMAVTIGGLRRYKGFESFGLDSYDNGDLEHFINERPIVSDELTKEQKLQALQAGQAPLWLIMRELDFDEETIDEVNAWKEEQDRNAVRGLAEGIFNNDNTDDSEAGNDTNTDTTAADTHTPVAA